LKNNFKENPSALVAVINAIPDSNAKNGQVSLMGLTNLDDKIFSIGKIEYLQKDFLTYVNIASRDRLYGTKENAVRTSYNTFLEKTLMEYEENNLANENPEFRNLIKEYRDGIILFDLTDKSVWTKASNDSLGLDKFYNGNKQKYNWTPCFEGDVLKFNTRENAEKFLAEIKKGTSQEKAIDAVNAVSGATATPEKGKYEYEKYGADIKNVKANAYSAIFKNSDNSYSIAHPVTIYTTATPKTLSDARGYVIADYQDYLEKQWIQSMENKYPVVVNEPVFKSMIAK
jgi:peptidyl-prolyl cis-trans isomerase SurA